MFGWAVLMAMAPAISAVLTVVNTSSASATVSTPTPVSIDGVPPTTTEAPMPARTMVAVVKTCR